MLRTPVALSFAVCFMTGFLGAACDVPLWQLLPLGLVLWMAIAQGVSER